MTIRRVPTRGIPANVTMRQRVLAKIDLMAATIIGMIQRRTGKGTSSKGSPLQAYSTSYLKALTEGRESHKVDLTLTGSYLADIGLRKKTVGHTSVTIVIGPGTGTSPQVTPRDGHMSPTGSRSPPHNVLGRYLEKGTPKMRARPHLGMTPQEISRLSAMLTAALKGP